MENYKNIHLPWRDWKIVNYLGSGTYGRVYEIERNIAGIQEKAALKIISRPKDSSEIDACYDNGYDRASIIESYEKEIQSYVQEYNIMKELQGQSNIVSCDDFAVVPHEDGIGGDIFLRMELLTSLPQILRQQMLSEQEIIKLGKDISRALMLCESKNIIHRDIKPVNIMVSRFGDYKLGDFGVSKIMDHATYATAMGTPEYQAPEVVHMEKYGKTADIYSLGITLYWLLNNRKMPFIGADERLTPVIKNEATDRRYRGEQLPPPRDGSAELKQIVLKACAYRPQKRYKSAEEMNQALECIGNGQTTVRSEQQFCDETVGPDRFCGKEFTKQTAWEEEDYGVNQTAGNSWGASYGTIGKSEKNAQKKRAEDISEEAYTATVGVKQAYQKQQKRNSGIKPESEKTAQSFSAEKGLSKDITPSRSKSSLGKIIICLAVIGIILYVAHTMRETSLINHESANSTSMDASSADGASTDIISVDSSLDVELMNIFNNIPDESFEVACQWLEDNNYSCQDIDYGKEIEGSISQGEQWQDPIDFLSRGQLRYSDYSLMDKDAAHKRYVELFNECQDQWDIIFEADQANQCASEDNEGEVCLFEGENNRIYQLRRYWGDRISLDMLFVYEEDPSSEDAQIDINNISIPWDVISNVNLSNKEQLHAWADTNGFGFIDDSPEDSTHGYIYQPKDVGVTVGEDGYAVFESEPDMELWFRDRRGEKDLLLNVLSVQGTNVADAIKQIKILLENECDNSLKACTENDSNIASCEYGNKKITLGMFITGGGCFLDITEKK